MATSSVLSERPAIAWGFPTFILSFGNAIHATSRLAGSILCPLSLAASILGSLSRPQRSKQAAGNRALCSRIRSAVHTPELNEADSMSWALVDSVARADSRSFVLENRRRNPAASA